ncbi:MAG: hypothetical protein AAFX78_08595 [Cyanobacteria bacterium J06638_20]
MSLLRYALHQSLEKLYSVRVFLYTTIALFKKDFVEVDASFLKTQYVRQMKALAA